jgi:branched-subunit amino acid transport protein
MKTLLTFAIGGVASWFLRVGFIALAPNGHPPAAVARGLRYAAPAAFAALVGVSVSDATTGSGDVSGWPVLAATAVTLLVAWRTQHVALTLVAAAAAITLFTAV